MKDLDKIDNTFVIPSEEETKDMFYPPRYDMNKMVYSQILEQTIPYPLTNAPKLDSSKLWQPMSQFHRTMLLVQH